jgi:hypothetical protein
MPSGCDTRSLRDRLSSSAGPNQSTVRVNRGVTIIFFSARRQRQKETLDILVYISYWLLVKINQLLACTNFKV